MVTLEKVTLPYSARSAPGGLILSRKSRQTRCYSPFNVVFKLTRISKNLLKPGYPTINERAIDG